MKAKYMGRLAATILAMSISVFAMHGQIFEGWYADPDIRLYNGVFWVFPTTSIAFEDQSYFDAWSSPDLEEWTKHASIITTETIRWAKDNFWAPASVSRNEKYYLYFSANGLRTSNEAAGIGVAVADSPGSPYEDAMGRRLIDTVINNANPMDPDVFIDDDGQVYFYYGGTAANVALLGNDMVSFRQLPHEPNGTFFKDITPTPKFVEGTKVFKKNSVYYMMWSENGYGDPTYQVSYGTSDSPFGPFEVRGVILQQKPEVAVATGHNSIVNIPGTDEWYIFYHRRSKKEKDPNKRVIAYDPMYFNVDGTIQPVQIS